ncbi:MAG TPA: toll/interleukin-1 receptor domain-containing protein [Isosphaeraceae bacterium]|nr:toll/interleukin-1 receptor domain-containing protein [Isosphaeraceae bacterium]
MSIVAVSPLVSRTVPASTKLCFVIQPMGTYGCETRRRSEHVLETYIHPACKQAGYDPKPSTQLSAGRICGGIINALSCAPMTIAYMGSEPWNDDVMIEVGFRLASGLPLVVICDAPRDGQPFHLPMIINDLTHLQIPPPGAPDDPIRIDELLDLIRDAEQRSSRIDSDHPIALVHYYKARAAGMVDADQMHYIAASDLATELFGIKADDSDEYSLAGHTMKDFLDHLEYRMPRQHYEVFRLSQQSARQTLSERLRTNFPLPPAVEVPIVLNRHPNPDHIGRAFLPVIVSKYVSDDKAWCNLRVLYLEVTSQTEGKVPPDPIPPEAADRRYFVCPLASGDRISFESADRKPISVFISYNSADRDQVEQFRARLVHLSPAIDPWLDRDKIEGAEDVNARLAQGLPRAEVAVIFLGAHGPGPWQNQEVELIIRRKVEGKMKVLLVLLDCLGLDQLPPSWMFLQNVRAEKFEVVDSDDYLERFFDAHFGERFYC